MTRDLVPTNACASSAIVCHITWASCLLAEARRDATDVAKPITSIPITVAACPDGCRSAAHSRCTYLRNGLLATSIYRDRLMAFRSSQRTRPAGADTLAIVIIEILMLSGYGENIIAKPFSRQPSAGNPLPCQR